VNHSHAIVLAVLIPLPFVACSSGADHSKPAAAPSSAPPAGPTTPAAPPPLDWKSLEAPLLINHIQLTSRDKFVKAGEAYFDHHSPPRWVIFQAVAVPPAGQEADPFYSMYVARLRHDKYGISGLDTPVKISPDGSANTCGWFDPINKSHVIFGSTLVKPGNTQRPGFQVGTRSYVWMFPHEMDIVSRNVPEIFRDVQPSAPEPRWAGDALNAKPVFSLPGYDAECSFSKDGKFILYAHVRTELTRGKDDADIWIYNTQTGEQHELVHADGYDGGPFFSADNKRICYRSDRKGDDLLQLFIADLKFDSAGNPIGIEREHQVTDNGNVNWAPFWHPSGQFLIYGTSEVGHDNYEVFAVETPDASDSAKPAAQLRKRRITYANGADVLPVFSDDGQYMMWTAQRGPKSEGETKPSSQVWVARFTGASNGHEDADLFYLPHFEPPKTDADAIAIARRAVEINDTWAATARYDVVGKSNENGWTIRATRLPETPGGDRSIHINRNGTIDKYSRGL
jgi:TolB protein